MKIIENNKLEYSYPVGRNIKKLHISSQIIFENLKNHIKNNQKVNIFCTGSSGMCIASSLSSILYSKNIENRIVYIYKENESSHGETIIPDETNEDFNIVVDDCTSTGTTIRKINNVLTEHNIKIDLLSIGDKIFKGELIVEPKILICNEYVTKE